MAEPHYNPLPPAPSAIVNHYDRIAYIPVPKAGCSSIKYALREAWGLSLPSHEWQIHAEPWPDQLPLSLLPADIFTFAVVRNPWDRVLSLYLSKIHPDRIWELNQYHHGHFWLGMTFAEFVYRLSAIPDGMACDQHIRSQQELTSNPAGQKRYHMLIDLDQLQMQWRSILPTAESWDYRHHLPVVQRAKFPELKNLNQTKRTPEAMALGNPWTYELIGLVAERYAKDLRLLQFQSPAAKR